MTANITSPAADEKAPLDFVKGDKGSVTHAVLYQNGRDVQTARKK